MIKQLKLRLFGSEASSGAVSGEPGDRQAPLSMQAFWAIKLLVSGLGIYFMWMLVSGIVKAQPGAGWLAFWPVPMLLALLAVFIVASLATTEVIPWSSRSWEDWRRPKVIATLSFLELAAVGSTVGVSAVFQPNLAQQATVLAVKAGVTAMKGDTAAIKARQGEIAQAVGIGAPSLIRQQISGLWGRPGCAVVYRFALTGQSLAVQSVRLRSGMPALNSEYTVLADRNSVSSGGERVSIMETSEVAGFWPGFAVQFRYANNGSNEALIWDHRKMQTMPLELVRCPEVAAL